MIPNYAFKTLLNFTMYVVNQKKKKEKKITVYVDDVYLYCHNLCPLLLFCVTLLCSLKSFKKEKRKCNFFFFFVSFYFLLMLFVFLNIKLFKTSLFPTFYHFFNFFQDTSIP